LTPVAQCPKCGRQRLEVETSASEATVCVCLYCGCRFQLVAMAAPLPAAVELESPDAPHDRGTPETHGR
jgi:hypothetical protein